MDQPVSRTRRRMSLRVALALPASLSQPAAAQAYPGRLVKMVVASVPGYPTLEEAGITGFNGNSWLGLGVSASTPKDIVARLSTAAANALRTPEIRERFISQGVEPVGSMPQQYAAFIEAEIPRWAEAARAARITPQ